MKILKFLPLVLLIILNSCGSAVQTKTTVPAGSSAAAVSADTSREAEISYVLEDLLHVKDEADLIRRFGKENVEFDTIWGPEGMWTMGTYLFHHEANEVEIGWKDSLKHAGMAFAHIVSRYQQPGKLSFDTRWKTRAGISLGTTIDVLEKLNGRSFTFSGFEWDYGGYVNWGSGNLATKGINVVLYYDADMNLSIPDHDSISGDRILHSDNALVRSIHPYVMEITVNEDAAKDSGTK